MAVFLGMIAASNRYSTHHFNCHELINILNKAQYENRLEEKLKTLAKYKVLIIDEIGYLSMDIQGANLFGQNTASLPGNKRQRRKLPLERVKRVNERKTEKNKHAV